MPALLVLVSLILVTCPKPATAQAHGDTSGAISLEELARRFSDDDSYDEALEALTSFGMARHVYPLYNACRPMTFISTIESPIGTAADIGLTDPLLRDAVERRLRSARLYASDPVTGNPFLHVHVQVLSRAFHVSAMLQKRVEDPEFDIDGIATTWMKGGPGVHGGDLSLVLSAVDLVMNAFILEYLRVNETACGGP